MSFRVLLVTDPRYDVVPLTRAALVAARPGEVAVMARLKGAGARELAALARALLPVCRERGAALLVNDRCDIARAVGADGAHLPESGPSVADARAALGPSALVGASRHGPRVDDEAPDYVTLAPVDEVPGKGPPLGLDGFEAAARSWPAPAFALGGVDAERAPELIRRGAAGVAVMRAVFGAADPAAALGALLLATRDAGQWRKEPPEG
ncbi:MAG: thiamine phosphate synthase [Sandaracinaceae bacterium]|nr:thiamine phosphate synthase [Sandaracinaceae bacterium]